LLVRGENREGIRVGELARERRVLRADRGPVMGFLLRRGAIISFSALRVVGSGSSIFRRELDA